MPFVEKLLVIGERPFFLTIARQRFPRFWKVAIAQPSTPKLGLIEL
jgi:hypothetical protein